MSKDKTIALRVAQGRYDEWEGYVEEDPKLDNLSQLLRSAVEEELAGNGKNNADGEAATVANVEGQLEQLNESVQQLTTLVRSVDSRLSTLENRVDEQSREIRRVREADAVDVAESIGEAGEDITDILPRGEPESEEWHEAREWAPEGVDLPIVWSGRVSDIVEEKGVEQWRVSKELDKVEHPVKYEVSQVDGDTRYWVDETMAEWAARQQGERV